MKKFSNYIVFLKNLEEGISSNSYQLGDEFFATMDFPDLQKGEFNANLEIKRRDDSFELSFDIEGVAVVPCDRCLDDLSIPLSIQETIYVRLGEEYSEEDDLIVIPEEDGELDVSHLMFEFVALNLPERRIHPKDECNQEMYEKLKEMIVLKEDESTDEDYEEFGKSIEKEDSEIDPRWNELKKIIDNK